MNTLGVRSAIGSANRRKLSFRNVSNVVVQLLHTIKYSVPAPFSHLTAPNTNYMSPNQNSSVMGKVFYLYYKCLQRNLVESNQKKIHTECS